MSDAEVDADYEYEGEETWETAPSDTHLFDIPPKRETAKILTPEEVCQEIENAITDVVNVLAWSRTSSLLILRHFKWSSDLVKERYFDDPDSVTKKSGIANMDDNFILSDATATCSMCWDQFEAGKTASLACAHPFCFSCWASNLSFHFANSGMNAIAVHCPTKGCPQFCGKISMDRIFGPESAESKRYLKTIFQSFVSTHDRFRSCPAALCEYVVKYPVSRGAVSEPSAPVRCLCGYRYCFVCGFEDHSPASCAMMEWWKKKEVDESETANWVAANTKPCPGKNCGKTVEKNGGCNHMTCSQCKWEWCWVCEGPWSEHGSSYYKCNYYKEDQQTKSRSLNRDAARTELERYIHYYTRYQNHGRSRKLDSVVLENTRRRIAVQLQKTNQSVVDLDYLQTTASVLTQCRHVLMYTYVYAFYLADQKQKDLFEYNQSQLEYWTELLSEFIEDFDGHHSKQEVVNRTSTADKMLQKLQEGTFFKVSQ
jgi:ariadne-1